MGYDELEEVRARAELALARGGAGAPGPQRRSPVMDAIRQLPDEEAAALAEIVSEGYERTRAQERALRIIEATGSAWYLENCRTPADVAESGMQYMLSCLRTGRHMLPSGLARWLGLTEPALHERLMAGDAFSAELARLMAALREYADDAALTGDFVPAYARWKDEASWGLAPMPQRVLVTHSGQPDARAVLDELARRLGPAPAVVEGALWDEEEDGGGPVGAGG